MTTPDILGLLGVAMIVIAYGLLQLRRLTAEQLSYSVLNALGAALVLISLYFDFNLPSAIIEGFWLLISLFGIWRVMRQRR